tara:strand:+ start:671 stop:1054 length:384 start_codon:yes stop_codon:yes gene_type:complete
MSENGGLVLLCEPFYIVLRIVKIMAKEEPTHPIDKELAELRRLIGVSITETKKLMAQLSALQLCVKSMEEATIEIKDDGTPVFIPPKVYPSIYQQAMEYLSRRDTDFYKLAKEQGLVGRTDIVIEEE